MADRVSALADLAPPAPAAESRVRLSEVRTGVILQIAAWPDTLVTVRTVIAELTGCAAPGLGTAVTGSDVTIAAIAPGRFLLAGSGDDLAARFEAALPAADGAVTDLSHGRAILRLQGGAAAAVLAKCAALDLDPQVFPPGRAAQTMIHHIDVLLHRTATETFELWVLRGFAEALGEWLIDAGLEFGVEVCRL
jgi:sarcosine oxidase subunit gamma